MSRALAQFVRDRATEEIVELGRSTTTNARDPVGRLNAQAETRIEVAEQYLRLCGSPMALATGRAHELLRTVCLLARLDQDHPGYDRARADCALDCSSPLW